MAASALVASASNDAVTRFIRPDVVLDPKPRAEGVSLRALMGDWEERAGGDS